MTKSLFFYFYISDDFNTNEAVKVHQICLSRYINVFDTLNFIVALNNLLDFSKQKTAIEWINGIVGDKKYTIRFTPNTNLRESIVVLEDFLPKMLIGTDEIIFMSHMKGVTNVNDNRMNKFSVLRWIISMYWYTLEYTDNINNFIMSDKKTMYGPLLTHFDRRADSAVQNHNKIYIGGFYWFKPYNFLDNCLYIEKIPQKQVGRYFNENLPMCLNSGSLSSYNDVCIEGKNYNLYNDNNDKWLKFLSEFGDINDIFEFQNKILLAVCGEIGK